MLGAGAGVLRNAAGSGTMDVRGAVRAVGSLGPHGAHTVRIESVIFRGK